MIMRRSAGRRLEPRAPDTGDVMRPQPLGRACQLAGVRAARGGRAMALCDGPKIGAAEGANNRA